MPLQQTAATLQHFSAQNITTCSIKQKLNMIKQYNNYHRMLYHSDKYKYENNTPNILQKQYMYQRGTII